MHECTKKEFGPRGVPGRPVKVLGHDRTGPRDPEGPVVLLSRDQRSPKVPGLFLKVPGPSGPFFPLAYHEILKRPDQSVFLPDFSFLYVHSFLL